MIATEIYNILRAGGLSRAGALGMLGNMMAESSLKANIAQRGMTTMNDVQYTEAANEGRINFAHDGVGYGLCQWTFYSRKQALLDYARTYGVSVGDGQMQCNFCLMELREDYGKLFKFLCEAIDVEECADRICTDYERPAVNNFLTRRNFAKAFEKEIPEKSPVAESGKKKKALQLLDELRAVIEGMEE